MIPMRFIQSPKLVFSSLQQSFNISAMGKNYQQCAHTDATIKGSKSLIGPKNSFCNHIKGE
jgi:hypothetical protein